ncbi:uncharacterized protein TNIN_231271 [Trichonephila inaurata madagascariensis]|uniref:Trichohyalin-plectin-homology domain-containing protein n=1 Tax=Trichonephila inaurata madagascariensis TaxID=2747483 RepID=A0A8X6XVY0_9ARAC|nr:uncharacterized protein TNIN_231271 [Trichonephila inaurata madagascariensis]
MTFAAKNQTNPVTIAATGYKPYIEARAFRASQKKGVALSKAERNAQKIQDYWAQQDVLHQIKDYAESHEKTLFRNRWECAADKKSLYSRVQWEMDKITSKMDEDLDRRRNRLTDLLRNEENMLLKESVSQGEDEESKHARMLSRYTELKIQKEADRQKVAEEKKEQQFRNNCEELRTRMSRKLQQQTIEDGRKIECERRCGGESKNEEEAMYAELWEKDVWARKQREEKEEELKKQRDVEYSKYVTEQMEEKRLEKMRKLREKETEAEIRVRGFSFHSCFRHDKKNSDRVHFTTRGIELTVEDSTFLVEKSK